MTDMGKPDGAAGPPWSVDLLADLHAGALDEARAAELWPRVQADAEAIAVLQALDATTSDLATLVQAPASPMPAHFAARLDAALAAEAARGGQAVPTPLAAPQAPQAVADPRGPHPGQPERLAPVVDLATARRKRNRLMGWGAGLATVAAAAVAAIALIGPGTTTSGTPLAGGNTDGSSDATQPNAGQPPGAAPSFEVDPDNPSAAMDGLNGVQEYGQMESREGLESCLQAHDIPTTGQTAGVKPGKVEGQDAVIAVLTTGEIARFRIVAVSPDCSTDNPGEVFLDKEFGR